MVRAFETPMFAILVTTVLALFGKSFWEKRAFELLLRSFPSIACETVVCGWSVLWRFVWLVCQSIGWSVLRRFVWLVCQSISWSVNQYVS